MTATIPLSWASVNAAHRTVPRKAPDFATRSVLKLYLYRGGGTEANGGLDAFRKHCLHSGTARDQSKRVAGRQLLHSSLRDTVRHMDATSKESEYLSACAS